MITIAKTAVVKLKSKIMREIEFRVQVLDNLNQKYWIYIDLGKTIENPIATGFAHGNHVIKETVGQFTGLLDKNGKKIFEGDVLKIESWSSLWFVIFDDKKGHFTCKGLKSDLKMDYIPYYHSEIIGNVHDNPELLK